MPISDTTFFNGYQRIIGLTYENSYAQQYIPGLILPYYETARQSLLSNFATNEVTNGLNIVNNHLSSESVFTNATANIVRGVLPAVNTFFNQTYGVFTRDYFTGLTPTSRIAWENGFKEAWYQANTQELVQQIGYATWNGTAFVFYPTIASANVYSPYISATIAAGAGTTEITITNTNSTASFALIGYTLVASTTSSLPSPTAISLATSVVGYMGTNILILSNVVSGSATSAFAFRPIKNPEYLEFRFGTSASTGLAATKILQDLSLNVTLTGGSATTTVGVAITTGNIDGRATIGNYGNTAFKATGISAIAVNSGNFVGLGSIPSLEIWVRATN